MFARRSRSVAMSAGSSATFRLRRRAAVWIAEMRSPRRRAERSAHSSAELTFARVGLVLTCHNWFIELPADKFRERRARPDGSRLDAFGQDGKFGKPQRGIPYRSLPRRFPEAGNCVDISGH